MQEVELLVSVIIPCYNAERFLRETTQSVFIQDYKAIEVIIVNDGSKDNSVIVIETLKKEYPLIQSITTPNQGVSAARNTGLRAAKGTYVVFLDADDVLTTTFISSRVQFLEKNPQYGICGTSIKSINEQGRPVENAVEMKAPDDGMLHQILLYQQPYASIPSNLLMRRSLLVDNNIYFNPVLSSTADKFFLCELAAVTECKSILGGELLYRVTAGSMSNKLSKKLLLDNERFLQLLIEKKLIPASIYKTVVKKNYYILAGLSKRVNSFGKMVSYGVKYLLS